MKFFVTAIVVGSIICLTQALTSQEIAQFKCRTYTEKNTGKQCVVNVTDLGNGNHLFYSNGIPDHKTGTFPGDYNPNELEEKLHRFTITDNPKKASEESCLPAGTIGMTINGQLIFNPFTDQECDAVNGPFKETFDSCGGHPSPFNEYHYHGKPNCLFNNTTKWDDPDVFLGVALDGYPIYGPVDSNNTVLTSADLDKCHGREENGQYRYRFTTTFPYFLGCYRGEVNLSLALGTRVPRTCQFATNVDEPNANCKKAKNSEEAVTPGLIITILSVASFVLCKFDM